jgi:hypothetical protein
VPSGITSLTASSVVVFVAKPLVELTPLSIVPFVVSPYPFVDIPFVDIPFVDIPFVDIPFVDIPFEDIPFVVSPALAGIEAAATAAMMPAKVKLFISSSSKLSRIAGPWGPIPKAARIGVRHTEIVTEACYLPMSRL